MSLPPELRFILARLHIAADPAVFLSVFILAMARMGAAVPFIPFLGGQAVPGNIQVAWTMLVGIILYPSLSAEPPGGIFPGFISVAWVALLFKELLIGAVIGLLVQIVFSAAEGAGTLIEFVAELKQQEILAPQTPAATGPLSVLMGHAATVLYLSAGIHLILIRALADSYRVLPLFTKPQMQPGFVPLAELAGRVSGGFVTIAFQLSAPILLVLVLIKVASNLVFRVSWAGMRADPFQPFGSLAAFGLLFLAGGLLSDEIVKQAAGQLARISQFVNQLR